MPILHRSSGFFAKKLGNWFGDGTDGDIRITSAGAEQSFTGGVTWSTIPGWVLVGSVVSIPSVQDGDMVVVNARGMTIDTGYTLTVANRCRGLIVYGTGNGDFGGPVSMTGCGCHANPADAMVTDDTPVAPGDGHAVPEDGITIRRLAIGGTDTDEATDLFHGCGTAAVASEAHQPPVRGNGYVIKVPRTGGPGGVAAPGDGPSGGTVENGTGGGGAGASAPSGLANDGVAGTCFGGGPGSGGQGRNSVQPEAAAPAPYGGRGGLGTNDGQYSGGGAGNPGGDGGSTLDGGNLSTFAGESGCGGFLLLIFRGNLTVAVGVAFTACGKLGGTGTNVETSGGSSGGGFVCILYAGQLNGTVTGDVTGGASPDATVYKGGPGGPGSFVLRKINR